MKRELHSLKDDIQMHITELTAFHKLKKKKNEGPLLSSFYEISTILIPKQDQKKSTDQYL